MKKKTANAKKIKLSSYEQAIEDQLDYKALKKPSKAFRQKIRSSARTTIKENKEARANIRMNETDLAALRELAENSGMPYQTLLNHIIHLYVTGQLIHAGEVKKLVKAGAFDR